MIPSNFIPVGSFKRMKPVIYTDGSSSREIEEEEETPTINQLSNRLTYIIRLIQDIQKELAKYESAS
jgi:hypothetical protein